MTFWSRERIALVACAAASALAMLYVGFFQIHKLDRLACPLFGSGCESVALASFAWPLGMADGLLGAACAGVLCALADLRGKAGAAALAVGSLLWVLLNLVGLIEMASFGAYCFWCIVAGILSLPTAWLAIRLARQPQEPEPA